MDISELQLKINKNKAVNDLKAVEGQLEKTGGAADNLVSVLKDVGLTIGFGALVKESLQLNNQFSALENRLQSIFGKSFDTSTISNLASSLNISNNQAKSLLSTIGQFSKGMGQSAAYTRQFSEELTKAAVDYGTFIGKTSQEDFTDIARKFAKATLGEVGELKEIGIVIDVNTESFKKLTKEIQNATGASEAQAKQMAIQKEILNQVDFTSGAASQNTYDGWTQLNRLFNEFKEVLAEVGQIFSTALGPALKILGDLVAIPFVKHTLAWSIAIGGIIVGYVSLISVLSKISNMLKDTNEAMKLPQDSLAKLVKYQHDFITLKTEEMQIQSAINKLNRVRGDISAKAIFPKLQLRMAAEQLGIEVPRAKGDLPHLEESKKIVKDSLASISQELLNLGGTTSKVIPNISTLNPVFTQYLQTLGFQVIATKSLTAARLGEAVALKLTTIANASYKKSLSALLIPLKKVGAFFKALWASLAGSATGVAAFKAALGTLWAVFAKLVIIIGSVIILFDGITMIINAFKGKDIYDGTIAEAIAKMFTDLEEALQKGKELDNARKELRRQILKIADLKKDIEKIHLDRKIEKMLPTAAISALETRANEYKTEMDKLAWIIDNMSAARKMGMYRLEEGETPASKRLQFLEKLNKITKEYYSTEDKIAQARKNLMTLNLQYFKDVGNLNKAFKSLSEEFSYAYKNGKFQQMGDFEKNKNVIDRINAINKILGGIKDTTSLDSLEFQKESMSEIFELTRSKYKYEVDALVKQRETQISNIKSMNELLKLAARFRQTTTSAVDVSSTEALILQSRRMDAMDNKELAPIIEQQKQVKEIERAILQKQSLAISELGKINGRLYDLVNKIGTAKGVTVIQAVSPL